MATMRHRAVNKKLIFFSCIQIPSSLDPSLPILYPPPCSILFRQLIQSLIGKEGAQLYSYKRKLHQQFPITFLFPSSRCPTVFLPDFLSSRYPRIILPVQRTKDLFFSHRISITRRFFDYFILTGKRARNVRF